MLTAEDISLFFIAKGVEDNEDEGISNLKLQKLLYYAQGFYLALFNKPLFKEKIEAWTHGPVCPDIYRKYKSFKSNPITLSKEKEENFRNSLDKIFTEEQIEFLNEIWSVFGQFSAWKLRDMTHEEKPWMDNERNASEISKKELKEYFSTRIKN